MKHRQKLYAGCLLTAACAGLTSIAVQAAEQDAPQLTILAKLTGSEGAAPGSNPVMPPVLVGERIYGVANGGPAATSDVPFPSMVYGVDVAGAALGQYSSYSMGALGWASSTLVPVSAGLLGAISTSMYNSTAGLTRVIYRLDENGAAAVVQPDATDTWQRQLAPRGQLAVDDDGNVYLGTGGGSGAGSNLCQSGTTNNVLWRMTPSGQLQRVVDFCQFVTGTTRAVQTHDKGGVPTAMVWSQSDQALYVLTHINARGVAHADATSDYLGRSVGTLVRIGKQALEAGAANDGVVAADDLVVLHNFRRGRDGVPASGETIKSSLVEDGEWLYGTAQTNDPGSSETASKAYGGTVWRMRKSDAASFAVLHAFRSDTSADRTAVADGAHPFGPLVRAADGNIYGTTANDGTLIYNQSAPVGAGTIFRVRVGQMADRSDDAVEIVHRLDAATEGANPVGLSAGLVANGKQLLYGATIGGGNGEQLSEASADGGITGNGTIFQIAVTLPAVDIAVFNVNGSAAATVEPQAALLFAWESAGAQVCQASGTWEGSKAVSDQESLFAPDAPGEYTYSLVCTSDVGVESEEKQVSVTVQAPAPQPEPEPQPEPQPTPETSSGGGGGGALGGLLLPLLAGLARRRRCH